MALYRVRKFNQEHDERGRFSGPGTSRDPTGNPRGRPKEGGPTLAQSLGRAGIQVAAEGTAGWLGARAAQYGGKAIGAAAGSLAGTAAGAVLGPVGAVVGGRAGQFAGSLLGGLAGDYVGSRIGSALLGLKDHLADPSANPKAALAQAAGGYGAWLGVSAASRLFPGGSVVRNLFNPLNTHGAAEYAQHGLSAVGDAAGSVLASKLQSGAHHVAEHVTHSAGEYATSKVTGSKVKNEKIKKLFGKDGATGAQEKAPARTKDDRGAPSAGGGGSFSDMAAHKDALPLLFGPRAWKEIEGSPFAAYVASKVKGYAAKMDDAAEQQGIPAHHAVQVHGALQQQDAAEQQAQASQQQGQLDRQQRMEDEEHGAKIEGLKAKAKAQLKTPAKSVKKAFDSNEARDERGRWTGAQRHLARMGVNRRAVDQFHGRLFTHAPSDPQYVGQMQTSSSPRAQGAREDQIRRRAGQKLQRMMESGKLNMNDLLGMAVSGEIHQASDPNTFLSRRQWQPSSVRNIAVVRGSRSPLLSHEIAHSVDWKGTRGRMLSQHPDFIRAFGADKEALSQHANEMMSATPENASPKVQRIMQLHSEGKAGQVPDYWAKHPSEAFAEAHRALTSSRTGPQGIYAHIDYLREAMPRTLAVAARLLRHARILKAHTLFPNGLETHAARQAGGPSSTRFSNMMQNVERQSRIHAMTRSFAQPQIQNLAVRPGEDEIAYRERVDALMKECVRNNDKMRPQLFGRGQNSVYQVRVAKRKGGDPASPSDEGLEGFSIVTELAKDFNTEDKLARGLVYGWASVIEKDGEIVTDHQGDRVTSDELMKAAHDFVSNSRQGGVLHDEFGHEIGHIVESVVFTKELQDHLGIDLKKVGWLIGYQIVDAKVKMLAKSGLLKAFSIGGRGRREAVNGEQ